ncbi:putative sporulation protein (polysaccharide deacetylase family) [Bacillus ectoiniformans]|uniref:polysaccharide deacetylase family protein n=1 Tax=Bacillus ectoiniformans TaxID=1494429 RepID=UPI00195671A6|nr:polysaccharide deacetylase family protein [Bacillus ectoiniformans]MBM7647081.1 putative sporulation protein (polysaccharide deacetylase family) [Bacillus ectoiniformans]
MKKFKLISGIIAIAVLSLMIVETTAVHTYISQLKSDAVTVHSNQETLESKVQTEAKKRKVDAQNARIDPVWKAIPGYNGLEVDIKKSIKSMKKDGTFDEKHLIYKQVRPEVHLKDLPPAPIYRGHPDKPMVSMAINVAWGEEFLPNMLSVLKKHNVHATFFFEGRWAKEHPDLVKMITDSGHEAGNHSYSHPDMAVLSNSRIREEIEKTNEVLEAAAGVKPELFAPPSGSYRDETVKVADQLNMNTILWTVDTIDWKKPAPNELINRVTAKMHPGAIILMHPTESTSKSLDRLIKEIQSKDLKIDTVSQLLNETRIFSDITQDK